MEEPFKKHVVLLGKRLLNITKVIESLYKKLYNFELTGKKDSQEYNETIEKLKISLVVEQNIYNEDGFYPDTVHQILRYLFMSEILGEYKTTTESLLSQSNYYGCIRRIRNNLYKKLYDNGLHNPYYSKNQLIKLKNKTAYFYKLNHNNLFSELNEAFNEEILSIFLLILEKYVNANIYDRFRENLLKVKYDLAFTKSKIERSLIECNFDIKKFNPLSSLYMINYLNITNEVYNLIKNQQFAIMVRGEITKIMNAYDYEYNKARTVISSILRQAYIRAGLVLMDENSYEDVKQFVAEIIFDEDINYLNECSNGVETVKDALNAVYEDRQGFNTNFSFIYKENK